MTEILRDKVLISLFFKFKISTIFYDISYFLSLYFKRLMSQDLLLFVFINEISILTLY